MSFVDDFSHFVWIYFIHYKSDVHSIFLQFQYHVERMLGKKNISILSDWGGEFHKLHRFFTEKGISHRISCPHTHYQNGLVEHKHRHIVETGITLLAQSRLPIKFWDEAFHAACFLINRMPSRVIQNESPSFVSLVQNLITRSSECLVVPAGPTLGPITQRNLILDQTNVYSLATQQATKDTSAWTGKLGECISLEM